MYRNRGSRMDENPGYRKWIVPEPRAVFLLVHGIGAYSERWNAAAGFLLKNNISSYAIECPEPENYSIHILRLHAVISRDNPGKKVFLAGESMGAIASILLASRRSDLFSGLICLSPAFKNKLKLSAPESLNVLASLLYNPKREIRLPFDSSMCTRDSEYIKKMDSDAYERRRISARSVFEIILLQSIVAASVKKLALPALFLVAGDDRIADAGASVKMFKRLTVEDRTLVEYPGMYHSLSIELGKEKVFEDMLRWAEKRI